MSQIESAARPFLEPMILGGKALLTPEAQQIIGDWASLKATVARSTHDPPESVSQHWLDRFYEHHAAPKEWFVWLSAYHGSLPVYYKGFSVTEYDRTTAVRSQGILATFVIGHLAVKCLGIRHGPAMAADADYMLQVFPASTLPMIWPPRLTWTDESLDAYCDTSLVQPVVLN